MDVTCSVDECGGPVDRKGLCQKHYMRQYRKGTTGLSGPPQKQCLTCDKTFQPQYNRVVYCSDLCRRGESKCETCGKTFLIRRGASGRYCSRDCWYAVDRASRPCPVCGDPFKGSSLTCSRECSQERQREQRGGEVKLCAHCGQPIVKPKSKTKYCSRPCAMAARPDKRGAPAPIGTRRLCDNGYVEIKVRNGPGAWVLEHRHLMEQILGRPLLAPETVHHRNGNRSDNTTNGPLVDFYSGNLELWSTSQPKGQRVADKLDHAMELFRLYRPDLADLIT